MTKNSYRNWKT